MLTEETVVDRTEIDALGNVSVRRALYILRDGVRIAGPIYHRVAYGAGDDVAHEAPVVQAVAALVWTPDVIKERHAREVAQVSEKHREAVPDVKAATPRATRVRRNEPARRV